MALSKIPNAGISNAVNFRNLIINGDMSISQRGTSFSVSDNIYTLDRFLTEFSGFGAFTLTQSTDSPDGFGHSLKLDCTTADASPASGDVFQLFHRIEGQNLQYLKKGTSSALSTTVSFFVKSNKTGNMQVNLRDAPNNRIIGGVYTINTANTWEKKTLTFAGDTSGTIDNDNTEGLSLEFPIGSGSDNSSGSVPTTWKTKVNADRNAGSTINLADSTSNEWYITGVQLEAGSVASDFEFLPVDCNLQRCLRYYEGGDANANAINIYGATNRLCEVILGSTARLKIIGNQYLAVKRATPTITLYGGSGLTTANRVSVYNNGADTETVSSVSTSTANSIGFYIQLSTTASASTTYRFYYEANAEL